MDPRTAVAGCPLCGPAPEGLLWESLQIRVVAVDDARFPGFVRVIWRGHVAEMTDLQAHERQRLMDVVWLAERLQRRILQPHKINLASLGNQVPHLHWHVIPRWHDDAAFPDPIWVARTQAPAQQAAWARRAAGLAAPVAGFHQELVQALNGKTP